MRYISAPRVSPRFCGVPARWWSASHASLDAQLLLFVFAMFDVKTSSSAPLESGAQARGVTLASKEHSYTPIRTLSASHRGQILQHLLDLSAHDRYLRFGYPATDAQVQRYVEGLDFTRDEVFGIHGSQLELVAVAHLAFDVAADKPKAAEFGVSVAGHCRGQRIGARLFERAVMHASNEGVQTIYIHALSENVAMLKIARKAGATVQRWGSESEAYLTLPVANLNSRLCAVWEDQIGEMDYRIKAQAYQFQSFLGQLQTRGPLPEAEPLESTE